MKALTLHQPWATLVALGLKEYETRSWAMKHRGPLAIHAARFLDEPAFDSLAARFPDLFSRPELAHAALPLGAVLCTVNVMACWPTRTALCHLAAMGDRFEMRQVAFGNWSEGRFAFKLAHVAVFPTPIPARGMQGLWNWTQDAKGQKLLFA